MAPFEPNPSGQANIPDSTQKKQMVTWAGVAQKWLHGAVAQNWFHGRLWGINVYCSNCNVPVGVGAAAEKWLRRRPQRRNGSWKNMTETWLHGRL